MAKEFKQSLPQAVLSAIHEKKRTYNVEIEHIPQEIWKLKTLNPLEWNIEREFEFVRIEAQLSFKGRSNND